MSLTFSVLLSLVFLKKLSILSYTLILDHHMNFTEYICKSYFSSLNEITMIIFSPVCLFSTNIFVLVWYFKVCSNNPTTSVIVYNEIVFNFFSSMDYSYFYNNDIRT